MVGHGGSVNDGRHPLQVAYGNCKEGLASWSFHLENFYTQIHYYPQGTTGPHALAEHCFFSKCSTEGSAIAKISKALAPKKPKRGTMDGRCPKTGCLGTHIGIVYDVFDSRAYFAHAG